MTNTEIRIIGKDDLDIEKIRAEITSLLESSRKVQAETAKIQIEAQTFKLRHAIASFAAAVVFLSAVVGLVSLFLK